MLCRSPTDSISSAHSPNSALPVAARSRSIDSITSAYTPIPARSPASVHSLASVPSPTNSCTHAHAPLKHSEIRVSTARRATVVRYLLATTQYCQTCPINLSVTILTRTYASSPITLTNRLSITHARLKDGSMTRQQSPQTPPTLPREKSKNPHPWQCKACTYLNHKPHAVVCEICGAMRKTVTSFT